MLRLIYENVSFSLYIELLHQEITSIDKTQRIEQIKGKKWPEKDTFY